jgi:hypothetical protein
MLYTVYKERCAQPSDINEHIGTLYEFAKGCSTVVELGLCNVNSAYGFAAALVGVPNNKLLLVDPYKSPNVEGFLRECESENVNARFYHGSDLVCPPEACELLFIDTWHVYGQLKRELARWAPLASKYIIMHDTTIDAERGESLRDGHDIKKQSQDFGIPEHEIRKGIWPAIEEFLRDSQEWALLHRFTNNNGLTILKRKDQ